MKTFYAAMIVFALLLALIIGNIFLIRHTMDEIEQLASAVPESEDPLRALAELEQYWQKKRPVVGLSVRGDMLLRIDEHISEARWAAEQQKTDELMLAVRLLRDTVAFLRKAESVSLDNVL